MKLFKTIEDFQQFVSVSTGLQINELNGYEQAALSQFIYPALSKAQFDELSASYAAAPDTPMSAELANLLPYVQAALSKFVILLWIPQGAVTIDSNGISVQKSERSLPASDSKISQLTKSFIQGGFADLEVMLSFLEERRGLMAYSSWKNSTAYTVFKQYFIQTANEFGQYVPISGRFTFLQLRGAMRSIQEFELRDTLQDPITDSILGKLAAGTALSIEETELMKWIQPALANLSISKAFDQLAVVQDERGISLFNTKNADVAEAWQALDAKSRLAIKTQYWNEGMKYLGKLKSILEAGAYTGYMPSTSGNFGDFTDINDGPNYFL